MKHPWIATILIIGCGTTRDSGCNGVNNTTTAERVLVKQVGDRYTCITDGDDGEYLCSPSSGEGHNYRCSDSAAADDKVKCIRWFPTE